MAFPALDAEAVRRHVPPDPVGRYARGLLRRGMGVLSGQFPIVEGELTHRGRLGVQLSAEQGRQAAAWTALNALGQMRLLLGDLDRVEGLMLVQGIVACPPGFTALAPVLDGASEVFQAVLGPRGAHARSAQGATVLPLDAPIELVVTFTYR